MSLGLQREKPGSFAHEEDDGEQLVDLGSSQGVEA